MENKNTQKFLHSKIKRIFLLLL